MSLLKFPYLWRSMICMNKIVRYISLVNTSFSARLVLMTVEMYMTPLALRSASMNYLSDATSYLFFNLQPHLEFIQAISQKGIYAISESI